MEDFVFTDEKQNELIELHRKNPAEFRKQITHIIRENPSKFGIMTVGLDEHGDHEGVTYEEFSNHFNKTLKSELIQILFNDIDGSHNGTIKIITIYHYVNHVKSHKKTNQPT